MAKIHANCLEVSVKRVFVCALLVCGLLSLPVAQAQCGGSCNACAQRFGCMTAAWGKCCTQFFMHNGKRSAPGLTPHRGPEEKRARAGLQLTLEDIIDSLQRHRNTEAMLQEENDDVADYTSQQDEDPSYWIGRRYDNRS